MLFAPKIQELFGEGYAYLDGDTLYLSDRVEWLFAVTPVTQLLSGELIDIIGTNSAKGWWVDWRIINARAIDLDVKMFQPYSSGKLHSIAPQPTYADQEGLRANFSDVIASSFQPCYDVREMYEKGLGHPLYDKRTAAVAKPGSLAYGQQAPDVLAFHTGDHVFAVPGTIFHALYVMGLTPKIPLQRPPKSDRQVPWMFVYEEADGLLVIGRFKLSAKSNVMQTPSGQPIFVDATTICWDTEEDAVKLLSHRYLHEHELHSSPTPLQVINSGDARLLENQQLCWKQGISILLWHGWAWEDIETAFLEIRADVLAKEYTENQENLVSVLNEASGFSEKHMRRHQCLTQAETRIARARRLQKALAELGVGTDVEYLDSLEAVYTQLKET